MSDSYRRRAIIAVMDYHTGQILYLGQSNSKAADRLRHGCVFGLGASRAGAVSQAQRRAREWRQSPAFRHPTVLCREGAA